MAENLISGPAVERVNVLGVGISILNLECARDIIAEAITAGRKGYITVTGVHGVSEAQEDAEFRRILNQFFAHPTACPWSGWASSPVTRK